VVGADSRGQDQHGDDEPRDQAAGLDAQKKTLAAAERREEERARFRQQMKDVDPKRLVVVDESGSKYGPDSTVRQGAPRRTCPWERAAPSREKYDPACCPVALRDRSLDDPGRCCQCVGL
jgi:hypothetical protein